MQVEIGKNYTIDSSSGFLIIAYPNKNVTTEFEY